MNNRVELNTNAACRVVGIDPDRLNENIAAGRFPCLPSTIRGRSRVFEFEDLLALWLFRALLEKTHKAKYAGDLACKIAAVARKNPDAVAVSVVETLSGNRSVHLFDDVPPVSEWGTVEFPMRGMIIHDVDTYNIEQIRQTIANRIQEEGFEK